MDTRSPRPPSDDAHHGGTPEGYTSEALSADELGKEGTPAAGLSPTVPHAADAEHPTTAAQADHVDHEEHEAEALGPINWRAWGAAALGLAIALGIALVMALPTAGS